MLGIIASATSAAGSVGFGSLIVVAIGALATVWLVRPLVEAGDTPLVARLVLGGLALRIGLAIAFDAYLPVGFFAPDQFTFEDVGWRTLQFHVADGPRPRQLEGVEVGYYYLNAMLFWLFGHVPLVPKLVNCFVGVWAVLVGYRLAGEVAGREPAQNVAILAMFFPSLVLWSTQNLRDSLIVLCVLLALLAAVRLRNSVRVVPLAMATITLAALWVLRDYMAWVLGAVLVSSTVLSPRRPLPVNLAVAGLLAGATATALYRTEAWLALAEVFDFESVSAQRQYLAAGSSAFRPEVDISSPLRGLAFLPAGIAFFLGAPFPWQATGRLARFALPETLVWYGLLLAAIPGGLFLVRQRLSRTLPLWIFLALTIALYGLIAANAGTAYRHRAQIVVVVLVLAGTGFSVRDRAGLSRGAAPGAGPSQGDGSPSRTR